MDSPTNKQQSDAFMKRLDVLIDDKITKRLRGVSNGQSLRASKLTGGISYDNIKDAVKDVSIEELMNVPALQPGKVLTVNFDGTGLEYTEPVPSDRPASPGPLDDEFSDAVLSTDWKWINPDGSVTAVNDRDCLVFSNLAADHAAGIVKEHDGTDITLTAHLIYYGRSTVDEYGGLCIGRGTLVDDEFTATKLYTFNINAFTFGMVAFEVDDLVADVSATNVSYPFDFAGMYVRMVFDESADTVKLYLSYEGIHYHYVHTYTGLATFLGGAPNFVGYYMFAGPTPIETGCTLISKWFRTS